MEKKEKKWVKKKETILVYTHKYWCKKRKIL